MTTLSLGESVETRHFSADRRPSEPQALEGARPATREITLAVRDGGLQWPAAAAASTPSSVIGGSACLVDNNEFGWIKIELAGEPVLRRTCLSAPANPPRPRAGIAPSQPLGSRIERRAMPRC
jgi:hypothetical protein